jgi:glycosyltransferase involved in cell wall biosynthesis
MMLSFIVPAYNEEHELPATLSAIKGAATEAGYPFDLIVVDDASTDTTATLARAAGAKVVPISRRQIAASRNAGARVATGEIVFFVDADTHITPQHVTGAVAALHKGYAGGSSRMVTDSNVPRWGRLAISVFSTVYFANRLGAGAFLFTTRDNFETVGGFDEQYFAGEEVFFSLALKKLGRLKILREPMITSGRKLRMHRGLDLWGHFFRVLFGGAKACQSREKLDLWYDGKREGPACSSGLPVPP